MAWKSPKCFENFTTARSSWLDYTVERLSNIYDFFYIKKKKKRNPKITENRYRVHIPGFSSTFQVNSKGNNKKNNEVCKQGRA